MDLDPNGVGVGVRGRGLRLGGLTPLIDGEPATHNAPELRGDCIVWSLPEGRAVLGFARHGDLLRLDLRLEGCDRSPASLGLRFAQVEGVRAYLRNGYQSWDGSYFVAPGTQPGAGPRARSPTLGFAMTALLPESSAGGAVLLGFTRHDRFQNRFRFGGSADTMTVDAETLLDGVAQSGTVLAEPLVLFEHGDVEGALRRWSALVAAESPLPPRLPQRRITGWCSWYNLYAAINEANILEHLEAARRFRDSRQVPLEVFQIDDGFTPEMGDWLDVKPQFPRGMAPLLADIDAAGFVPGLWIAPFLVGNRSRLFAEHPDWVVQRGDGDDPLVHARFYGEFRWHKRSEEYYVLDVTHPDAEAYIRGVFRTWRYNWRARYFKTDFMLAGMEYGPDLARWYERGLSRVAVWRRMARLIREEIGDALWLGCGCPLWSSVGFVDAVRIGRDIGVTWKGDYSAQSLLRDLMTRNHAAGILWQSDPDCVLLRDRFHELTDTQVRSLALFAGLSGGVLMTSDKLDPLSADRASLFAALLGADIDSCAFPELGCDGPWIVQDVLKQGRVVATSRFNPTDAAQRLDDGSSLAPHASRVTGMDELEAGPEFSASSSG
jgi:alpha-galactosidase